MNYLQLLPEMMAHSIAQQQSQQLQQHQQQQLQQHALMHGGVAGGSSQSAAAAALSSGALPSPSAASSSRHEDKIRRLKQVLQRNSTYQQFIKSQLSELELLLGVNSEKRRLVEQIEERMRDHNKSRTNLSASNTANNTNNHHTIISLASNIPKKAIFQAPFFIDANANTPPDNPDTLRKRRLRGTMPVSHRFVKWSNEEKRQLQQAILHQNQKHILQRQLEAVKLQFNTSGSLGLMTASKFRESSASIGQLQPEDYVLDMDSIDWNLVAGKYVRTRSAIDCRIQWCGNEDPHINIDPWTKQEDKKLLQLAKERQAHDWIEIARELATNRTAMQCFQRFQRTLNSSLIASRWKPEEDRKLCEEVRKYGERNWQQVASKMKLRTDQQCLHRWTKSVDPSIRSGRWSIHEDLRLRLAVKSYGAKHWTLIARHIPGRTDVKCRERWTNVLNPELTQASWTEEEDRILIELSEKYGASSWTKIAQALPPRTDNQCWRRWKKLADKNVLEEKKKETSRKVRAIVGVGRGTPRADKHAVGGGVGAADANDVSVAAQQAQPAYATAIAARTPMLAGSAMATPAVIANRVTPSSVTMAATTTNATNANTIVAGAVGGDGSSNQAASLLQSFDLRSFQSQVAANAAAAAAAAAASTGLDGSSGGSSSGSMVGVGGVMVGGGSNKGSTPRSMFPMPMTPVAGPFGVVVPGVTAVVGAQAHLPPNISGLLPLQQFQLQMLASGAAAARQSGAAGGFMPLLSDQHALANAQLSAIMQQHHQQQQQQREREHHQQQQQQQGQSQQQVVSQQHQQLDPSGQQRLQQQQQQQSDSRTSVRHVQEDDHRSVLSHDHTLQLHHDDLQQQQQLSNDDERRRVVEHHQDQQRRERERHDDHEFLPSHHDVDDYSPHDHTHSPQLLPHHGDSHILPHLITDDDHHTAYMPLPQPPDTTRGTGDDAHGHMHLDSHLDSHHHDGLVGVHGNYDHDSIPVNHEPFHLFGQEEQQQHHHHHETQQQQQQQQQSQQSQSTRRNQIGTNGNGKRKTPQSSNSRKRSKLVGGVNSHSSDFQADGDHHHEEDD